MNARPVVAAFILLAAAVAAQTASGPASAPVGPLGPPSRRYSTEELELVRNLARSGGGLALLDLEVRPRDAIPPAGMLELVFRFDFGGPYRKDWLLRMLQSRDAGLSSGEAESLRVCLHDPDDRVRCAAAHLLLDQGFALGDLPVSPGMLLGPRLRLRDAAALAEITKLLERRRDPKVRFQSPTSEDSWLLDQAAWGPADLIPLVRPFLSPQVHRAVFAFAKLGGPAEEIAPLLAAPSRALTATELIEAATEDAVKLLEANAASLMSMEPGRADFLGHCLGRRWATVGVRFVKAMGEPLKPCVPNLCPGMAFLMAAAGRESVIPELLALEWSERSLVALRGYGEPLARSPDPRVVTILVNALLGARRGFPEDCSGEAHLTLIAITNWLRRRTRADQDLALRLLEAAQQIPRDWRGHQLLLLRLALGKPPAPDDLLDLEDATGLADRFELTLVPWRERYAEVLPMLRASLRRHSFSLSLLGDESVVDDFGKWIEGWAADPREAGNRELRGLTLALTRIGGKRALEALYRAAKPSLTSNLYSVPATILGAIARLESPGEWKRVLALGDPAQSQDQLVRIAAVHLLGRKP